MAATLCGSPLYMVSIRVSKVFSLKPFTHALSGSYLGGAVCVHRGAIFPTRALPCQSLRVISGSPDWHGEGMGWGRFYSITLIWKYIMLMLMCVQLSSPLITTTTSLLTQTISFMHKHIVRKPFPDIGCVCEQANSRHYPELISLVLSGVYVWKRLRTNKLFHHCCL